MVKIQNINHGPVMTVKYLYDNEIFIVKAKKILNFFDCMTAVDFYHGNGDWIMSDLLDIRFDPTDMEKLAYEHLRLVA